MNKRSSYFTQSDLRKRHWTKGQIRKLLGVPDDYELSKEGHPNTKLYKKSRVLAVEKSAEFRKTPHSYSKTPQAAQRRKRSDTYDLLSTMSIKLPKLNGKDFDQLVIKWHNSSVIPSRRISSAEDFRHLEDEFCRMKVNYLRDHCTPNSENQSAEYVLVKERILEEIQRQYPDLASECERQLEEMQKSLRLLRRSWSALGIG